ncbi:MAG: pyruvate:ferredoxin (flavodoxin) oxidoreductase [Streptococcaceae bacterium]|jgi:pyruvate-ferredoxin/flavodoxin oxidoreductase|nr:pyruvate:ferredoxin (flavodoxin) oxidoreductase [Streptococcaceae bacterium]
MSKKKAMDGNTAAAHISYAFTEIAAIFPITPSSTMPELIDQWAEEDRKNLFDRQVEVIEMQSEAGAAGVLHGALKAGVLSTTYTASQGLLLMIPNMYKIAGEMLPTVFHVAARAVAANTLNIFGDHSDVMATRQTGFAMLAESCVQEVMDLSAVAHLATLKASVPVLNFFDGFRTSHEIQKIDVIAYEDLAKLVDHKAIAKFRARKMNPDHPTVSGLNEGSDIYFQTREAVNAKYRDIKSAIQYYMKEINILCNTNYDLVNYYGAKDATEVIVAMGSVNQTIEQTIDYLNAQGRKVGLINIRMYRPFPTEEFLIALPTDTKAIAVLDRTKEPGSSGEPLLLDVQSVLFESNMHITVIGGRYGLGSKDVRPDHIKSVYDELAKLTKEQKKRFTIGIIDDVTHTNLDPQPILDLTPSDTFQAKFWGLGSDGTIGANKANIKIIADNTDKYCQGYFEYDSKKSGGLTISHLRFGSSPIRSAYLLNRADFISLSNDAYFTKYDILEGLKPKGVFLLNTVWDQAGVEKFLPASTKRYLAENKINFYTINAVKIAHEVGLGNRTNTILQTAFFALSNIIEEKRALEILKDSALRAYGKKSMKIVECNHIAIDQALSNLVKVNVPASWLNAKDEKKEIDGALPSFVIKILEPVNAHKGDNITVSEIIKSSLNDGSMPLGTAAYEKRALSAFVAKWDADKCLMCNQCAFVCPHAAIRPFLADKDEMKKAPESFITRKMCGKNPYEYRIQVSVEDCTGCKLCIDMCPIQEKALSLQPYETQFQQVQNWAFAMKLATKTNPLKKVSVLASQFEKPLLEFSGACGGCAEAVYVKLLTQLFGDRMMVANATGCSSIWGGSVPATPYTTNDLGYGPAWSNSLFEDNAEYGFGMFMASKIQRLALKDKVKKILEYEKISENFAKLLKKWLNEYNDGSKSRENAEAIKTLLTTERIGNAKIEELWNFQDQFVKPSQWILGGDGWAYDIGFGGIDHVIATGEDVNVFVMDNEVYSNTGGQKSKATPAAAIAKFASSGNKGAKKDLGSIVMMYENVYVAQISSGANPNQTIKAMLEAENYDGPSIIIAYTPCIHHGLKGGLENSIEEAKEAVKSGYWSLYRYNPLLREKGKNPFILDYKKPNFNNMKGFMSKQTRFAALTKINGEMAEQLYDKTVSDAKKRFARYFNFAKN